MKLLKILYIKSQFCIRQRTGSKHSALLLNHRVATLSIKKMELELRFIRLKALDSKNISWIFLRIINQIWKPFAYPYMYLLQKDKPIYTKILVDFIYPSKKCKNQGPILTCFQYWTDWARCDGRMVQLRPRFRQQQIHFRSTCLHFPGQRQIHFPSKFLHPAARPQRILPFRLIYIFAVCIQKKIPHAGGWYYVFSCWGAWDRSFIQQNARHHNIKHYVEFRDMVDKHTPTS